ncbi:hypothetical protein F0310_04530 (plasmid) [Borrelia sp. A-FGy1]|uniref:hypothetical protein n=1 Tax=Borrelia sp. A-FGy1 TaxID=2608247 RepID=UPI0015F78624|nr:hypothetical protein [Borrelia sp. A-FGy1]QMU99684.1 hypothetical protein F0310_04530 [Borrelia sp. A-FGy1]
MRFSSGSKPVCEDFIKYQEYFKKALLASRKSRYGKVIEGLNLRFNKETGMLFISGGYGFTNSGHYVELKTEYSKVVSFTESKSHFVFLNIGNISNSADILVKDETGREFVKGNRVDDIRGVPYISLKEETMQIKSSFDPYYTLEHSSSLKVSDSLLLGCIYNDVGYNMNREENEPYFPVGTIIPYWGNFIDYVTLKGCRVEKNGHFGRLIRLDSKSVGTESGSWGWNLGSNSIPSLKTVETFTKESGGHKHSYRQDISILSKRYLYSNTGTKDAYFDPNNDSNTTYSGEHSHRVTARYVNSKQESINIFPDNMSCIPIRREY